MQNCLFRKALVCIVMVLFIGVSFAPVISVVSEEVVNEEIIDPFETVDVQEETTVACYAFDKTGTRKSEVVLSPEDFDMFYSKFEELKYMITCHPFNDETQTIKVEFVDLLDSKGLIPSDMSRDDFISLMNTPWSMKRGPFLSLIPQRELGGRGSAFFCNFATFGTGSQFPVIIFPRLIPILLIPIPRVFMHWNAIEGVTSCGGLISGKGFIALGQQTGTALGFWGIGFSIFLPPLMEYGFIGYALYATATAEEIEPWPPNNPPVVSDENPPSGAHDIPVSTSELSFRISDADGDRMSYVVTTEPNIGSGSGINKKNGVYKVPISGLEGNIEYTWHVEVTDEKDTVSSSFTFTTETAAPVVSDPLPKDGAQYVTVNLTQLSFNLKDFQGDPMDYTVETFPYIGSDSATGVGDGTYTVDVSGLDYSTDYIWYVNATDGTYWTREEFGFTTGEAPFDPFDEGWQYRKKITIDHTKVAGDITCFPVLVSTIDSDLRDKAQSDGDDILFMEDVGVATKLYHEIELYNDTSGELIAWVNIPSLTSDQDTILYMYYGNPGCGSQKIPESVWDNDYVFICHMNDSTTSTVIDSTSNNNDGVKASANNPIEVDAKIGKGQDFSGDYISVTSNPTLQLDEWTIEAWIKGDDFSSYRNKNIISKGYHLYPGYRNYQLCVEYTTNKFVAVYESSDGTDSIPLFSNALNTGTWYYVATTYKDQHSELYADDTNPDSASQSITPSTGSDLPVYIGKYYSDSYIWYFDGIIDEVRISNKARDASWIKTSFHTMNQTDGFLSFGPDETGP